MVILQEVAPKIIYDLQGATGKDIALVDAYGRPLGSTSDQLQNWLCNWYKQGRLHRGDFIICEVDSLCKTLTQEIILQEEIGGYLAISGEDSRELQALSRAVRWLTSFLIERYVTQPNAMSKEDLRRAYFEGLLFTKQSQAEIRSRASAANIDPEESCRVAVARIWYDILGGADLERFNAALKRMTARLEEFCANNGRLQMLDVRDKRILISNDIKLIMLALNYAADAVENMQDTRFQVYAGISLPSINHYNLRMCYENADIICERLANSNSCFLLQEECLSELLLEQIPMEAKEEFVQQIFRDCTETDVNEWAEIVRVLSDNNGSINRSAGELFMHKNTLQYRLTRIKERIGLDPRYSKDALTLQIAFMARKSVQNQKKYELF